MTCQCNEQSGGGDEEESENFEFDEMLIENAGNLFPQFGKAIGPELFAMSELLLWSGRACYQC